MDLSPIPHFIHPSLLACGVDHEAGQLLKLLETRAVFDRWKVLRIQPLSTSWSPDDFGSEVANGGPLTDVVVAEYGGKDTQIESFPRATTVTALLGNAFNHYKDPSHAYHLSTRVASTTKVWSLEYRDSLHAAERLIELLQG